jgi:hypothetical protein
MTNGTLVNIPVSTLLTHGTVYYASQTINGCESEYYTVTVQDIMANDSFTLKGIVVYPNPVTNEFTVSANETIASVAIFNMLGQKVHEQSSTENSVQVNIQILAIGTYLLQVTAPGGAQSTSKIIKQ